MVGPTTDASVDVAISAPVIEEITITSMQKCPSVNTQALSMDAVVDTWMNSFSIILLGLEKLKQLLD